MKIKKLYIAFKCIGIVEQFDTQFLEYVWCLRNLVSMAQTKKYMLIIESHTGADLGFSKGGVKPCSGSLKQGVWGQLPRSYRLLNLWEPKSKV